MVLALFCLAANKTRSWQGKSRVACGQARPTGRPYLAQGGGRIIARAKVAVGPDTGLMHIAAAVGTRLYHCGALRVCRAPDLWVRGVGDSRKSGSARLVTVSVVPLGGSACNQSMSKKSTKIEIGLSRRRNCAAGL
jgi:hypothetical protein